MYVEYGDINGVFTRFDYNLESKAFVLHTKEDTQLECSVKLPIIPGYKPEEFDFCILHNYSQSCTENSVFQLCIEDKRIGWLFPLQALFSSDHDFVENDHFLKYAYVALYKLLDALEFKGENAPDEFDLEEFYDDTSLCMMIWDRTNINTIEGFNIDHYTVSLYEFGYYRSAGQDFDLKRFPEIGRTKVHLRPISKALQEEEYILSLFKYQLPSVDNEIIRFYFIYQIIEILINIVFDNKFQLILEEIKRAGRNLFDIKDTIQNEINEKHRINLLFSSYSTLSDSLSRAELKESCDLLLTHHSLNTKQTCVDDVYAVRCFLVHRLYSLDTETIDILKEINRNFILVIIDLLLSFRIPEREDKTEKKDGDQV